MSAPYFLAIDVGTSRTAGATSRHDPSGAVVSTPLPLGRASDSAPTVVFVGDGELLFGDAAERRGISQPERLVREFKRRVGDDVPIVAGDRRLTAEELYALTVGWVIGIATDREGAHPAGIAITVPVSWGEYRARLVADALALHGWGEVTLITEPEAAARHYEADHPLVDGHALAVYDLGGGTFDAVVLRAQGDAVAVVGGAHGIADLGGADFDDAVLRHIVSVAGIATDAVSGQGGRMALSALRRECVEAKEALSFDSETAVAVVVDGVPSAVRLTRSELEDMIQPALERTADCLEGAIEAAGIASSDIDAVLLTGGSSRIPRIAQLLSERFDRPVALDADPKAIIALGAARAIAAAHDAVAIPTPAEVADAGELLALPADDAFAVPVSPAAKRSWFRRAPSAAFVIAGAVVLACGLVVGGAGTLARTGDLTMALPSLDDAYALLDQLHPASAGVATNDTVGSPSAPRASESADETSAAPRSAATPRNRRVESTAPASAAPRTSASNAAPSPSSPDSPSSGSSSSGSAAPSGSTPGTGTTSPGSETPQTPTQNEPTTPTTPSPQPEPEPEPQPDPTPTTEPTPEPTPDPTTEPSPGPVSEQPVDPPPAEPTTDPTEQPAAA